MDNSLPVESEQNSPSSSSKVDFPFYVSAANALSLRQWLLVLVAVACATAFIFFPIPGSTNEYSGLISIFLFSTLPLLVLSKVSPAGWRKLFAQVKGREISLMFAFALLNLIVSVALGLVVERFFGAASNPVFDLMKNQDAYQTLWLFGKSAVQLFGEELNSILPFLAAFSLFSYWRLSRTVSLVLAALVTAIWFSAIHLPTYNWQLLQCFIVIGSARIMLLLAYLTTKNLWVSVGAHIINDWVLFSVVILSSHFISAST